MGQMVRASGLVKRYKSVEALSGLDLSVDEGTVVALLGPNGAGKTTAVRVLATLLTPDAGTAEVAGVDVLTNPGGVRERIGLSGQYAAVDEHLTGYENLEMVGRLYDLGRARSKARARELLERFGLSDAADRPTKTYSGGMRRRLDLAASLIVSPPVIFLDEPTTGLDPRSRNSMWEVIKELVSDGTTVLLTTQYLEEADLLADRIVVIDHGKVIAEGTADRLKTQVGGERLAISVPAGTDLAHAERALLGLSGVEAADGAVWIDRDRGELTVPFAIGAKGLPQAVRELDTAGITLTDLALRRPTLDDVFLTLTGRMADDEGDAATENAA